MIGAGPAPCHAEGFFDDRPRARFVGSRSLLGQRLMRAGSSGRQLPPRVPGWVNVPGSEPRPGARIRACSPRSRTCGSRHTPTVVPGFPPMSRPRGRRRTSPADPAAGELACREGEVLGAVGGLEAVVRQREARDRYLHLALAKASCALGSNVARRPFSPRPSMANCCQQDLEFLLSQRSLMVGLSLSERESRRG
jgi:hypothetical protein